MSSFESLELTLLRQEIAILKQEKRLEREKLLKRSQQSSQRRIWPSQLSGSS